MRRIIIIISVITAALLLAGCEVQNQPEQTDSSQMKWSKAVTEAINRHTDRIKKLEQKLELQNRAIVELNTDWGALNRREAYKAYKGYESAYPVQPPSPTP